MPQPYQTDDAAGHAVIAIWTATLRAHDGKVDYIGTSRHNRRLRIRVGGHHHSSHPAPYLTTPRNTFNFTLCETKTSDDGVGEHLMKG